MKIYQVINYNQEKTATTLNKARAMGLYLNEVRNIAIRNLDEDTYDPMTLEKALLEFQSSHTEKTEEGYRFAVGDDCVEYNELIIAVPQSEIPEIDEWTFLEKWMRDYYHSDEIAWIGDIDKVLDGDFEDDEREFLQEYIDMPTNELEEEKKRLTRIVLEDAFQNYLDTNYPEQG